MGTARGERFVRNLFALAPGRSSSAGSGNTCRQSRGIHNEETGAGWKSEGSVVARKRVMTVERRDPTENHVDVRGKESRFGRDSHYGRLAGGRSEVADGADSAARETL